MNFNLHNKLIVKTKEKEYTFFNTLLNSILTELANSNSYNNFLSIGNGETDQTKQNQYHLTNYLKTITKTTESIQSDITKESLFATYQYKLNNDGTIGNYIKEIGLSNNSSEPTIYNYFSLITEENPNGLNIENETEIIFSVTIYLTIIENNLTFLTAGNNKFIEFLLGKGIGNIYICKGSNFSSNTRINRNIPTNKTKYLCQKTGQASGNVLTLNIENTISFGEVDEILFLTQDSVFARQNIQEKNATSSVTLSKSPKANYVIKINEDLKNISQIIDSTTLAAETNYYVSKYANDFGDDVSLPFNNMFDNSTSRFLSKDGKTIFFILNEKVYCYQNINFNLIEINSREIDDSYIAKIISFENYILIISKIYPYISTYIIENNIIKKAQNTINNYVNIDEIGEYLQIDANICNNNIIMIGYINKDNHARTIYINYSTSNGFQYDNYVANSNDFSHVLAMSKNNFCDGKMFYLKEGDYSITSRIVTHAPDKTEVDVYSSLAYNLLHDSKKVVCKNRALIAYKTTSPSVIIYYYPQVYQYNLPLISTEIEDYISNDLKYIIQKFQSNNYKIYNLIGYDEPEEFLNGFDQVESLENIVDFEFMNDTLLIFTNDSDKKIIAYNFKNNKTQIENLSSNNSTYLVTAEKYNKVGANDSSNTFKLTLGINL